MNRTMVITVVAIGFGWLLASPVSATPGLYELASGNLPPDSDWSWGVALGDLDGDGDLDIVFANDGQDRVYRNNGSGVFYDTGTNFPKDTNLSYAVALGDVDGDSDLDAVFANRGQDKLYLNNGHGAFADASLGRLPEDSEETRDLALGDVDGDSDLDIIFINTLSWDRLYLNDGSGVFSDAPPAMFSAGGGDARGIVLGDVDGNHSLDMAIAFKDARNRLHLNNGLGTFTDVTTTNLPYKVDNSGSIALGDLDGDADMDMVVANRLDRQSFLYLNDGHGVFADATLENLPISRRWSNSVALSDADGDGDLDIVLANFYGSNQLYLNDGSGVFSDTTPANIPTDEDGSLNLAIGDVDGDGDQDIVFAKRTQNQLYLNNTNPSLEAGPLPRP